MRFGFTEIILIAAITVLLFGSSIIKRFRGTFKKTKKNFDDSVGEDFGAKVRAQIKESKEDWE